MVSILTDVKQVYVDLMPDFVRHCEISCLAVLHFFPRHKQWLNRLRSNCFPNPSPPYPLHCPRIPRIQTPRTYPPSSEGPHSCLSRGTSTDMVVRHVLHALTAVEVVLMANAVPKLHQTPQSWRWTPSLLAWPCFRHQRRDRCSNLPWRLVLRLICRNHFSGRL